MLQRIVPALAGLTLAACASVPDVPVRPASYAAVTTRQAPRAELYAGCIAQAERSAAYAAAQDEDTSLILFTCTGAPARAFYEALAARSAAVGSEFVSEGRTFRSTNRVISDLFGVDYCSTGGGDDYSCVISLNAGEFLRESQD